MLSGRAVTLPLFYLNAIRKTPLILFYISSSDVLLDKTALRFMALDYEDAQSRLDRGLFFA